MNAIIIGKNIKKLREERNITQRQLAEAISITFQAISKWENGTTLPDVTMLPEIARYFDISIDELFKPSMKAYRHKGERLLSIYGISRSDDDFERANKAYHELISSGAHTPIDLDSYACLLDMRSVDYSDKAIEYYNNAIEAANSADIEINSPRDDVVVRCQYALIRVLARRGRGHESISKYKNAITCNPNNAQNYAYLSLAYSCVGKVDEDWDTIQEGLKIDPTHSALLLSAGVVCKLLGKYDEAIRYWDASYQADNESPESLFSKAFCYQELDQKDKAIEVWRQIIEWLETREFDLDIQFPKRELQKLLNDN